MLTARKVDIELGEKARLNRWSLKLRAGDRVKIGDHSIVDASLRSDRSPSSIEIGARTFIGGGSLLVAAEKITIGDDVLISWGVTIVDHDSHSVTFAERKGDVIAWGEGKKDWSHVSIAPIRICDKAWVGFGASILKGVTVGEGAVIGAKAVVTRDVEPWTVVGGNPARIIRRLEPGI